MTESDISLSMNKFALAALIQSRHAKLQDFFEGEAQKTPPPFYCSIDLRDSGVKIAPVDSNLFPAGFNNICPTDIGSAPPLLRRQLPSETKRVLIIPESHTQNKFYLENLDYLRDLLDRAGVEVRVGWYDDLAEKMVLQTASGREITVHPVRREGRRLVCDSFDPDVILLNNDFSSGFPEKLSNLEQPIVPDFRLGWHSRKKSTHFFHYNALAKTFAEILEIDSATFQIHTEEVDHVNFDESVGLDRVESAVASALEATANVFQRGKIRRKPFVFVKSNSGTYGMGILVVRSVDEVKTLNRRSKHKMSVGKNRSAITSVVVQEGIPTLTSIDGYAAEPVIYLTGCDLLGGFLRTNTERGDEDNLNSQGMVFRTLCMSDFRELLVAHSGALAPGEAAPTLEAVYGSIARISALAAGRELAALK